MDDPVRFANPIKNVRPHGARLLEAFSPKLGRRVTFYSRAAFEIWLSVEADPTVQTFCERPTQMSSGGREHTPDLWVRHAHRAVFLHWVDDDTILPAEWMGIEVRRVSTAQLAANRIWVTNWERMLPVITVTRDCVSKQRLAEVRRFVTAPMSLARIEREFVAGDPMGLRGAVFRLLAAGTLIAPALKTERLWLQTLFEPAP